MAKGLFVTLSMEWQCEQLACANALPAMTLGSALQGIAANMAENHNDRRYDFRTPGASQVVFYQFKQRLASPTGSRAPPHC